MKSIIRIILLTLAALLFLLFCFTLIIVVHATVRDMNLGSGLQGLSSRLTQLFLFIPYTLLSVWAAHVLKPVRGINNKPLRRTLFIAAGIFPMTLIFNFNMMKSVFSNLSELYGGFLQGMVNLLPSILNVFVLTAFLIFAATQLPKSNNSLKKYSSEL